MKNTVPLSYIFHCFWWEIYCHLNNFPSIDKVLLLFCCFHNIFLTLVFKSLSVFLWISLCLFSLRFSQFLDSVGLYLLPNLGSYQSFFLWVLPFLFWCHKCYIFCYSPKGSWDSVDFFKVIFSLLPTLDIFYCCPIKFIDSFPMPSVLMWRQFI